MSSNVKEISMLSKEIRKNGTSPLIKIRGITSLIILTFGIVVTISGVGLLTTPHGPGSPLVFAGMPIVLFKDLHVCLGFGMIGFILSHLILNYKALLSEIKQLFT
ncbi:DUF4405 domain-containing protein [Heliobacillus mobilis]|uniref:DUF4405 domain-containing protein n=1 Tax=Heliobacterium mobile TaxID=28064 RepID=A0A6I3SPF8_HELMO|nr:DUF4405 domain-containing protein [Heliobacterium mobile]MTV50940.1 DUF4405 domain-containing protein [Heliobacterium mobile]